MLNRILRHTIVVAALLAGATSGAMAQEPNAEAELFGKRQSVFNPRLSPSGDQMVFISPSAGSGETAYVVDLAAGTAPVPILANSEPLSDLLWCNFANEERVVCSIYVIRNDDGILLGFTRMLILNKDGSEAELLSQTASSSAQQFMQNGGSVISWVVPGEPDSILMTRQFVKESQSGTNIYNRREGLAVERVDINTLKRRGVERAVSTATSYMADENGEVRLLRTRAKRDGYWIDSVSHSYRKLGESEWTVFSNIGELTPVAVNSAANIAYAFGTKDGFDAIYTIALDGSEKQELLVARDDADVDSLLFIGKKQRIIGAGYATERREVDFFDKELEGLSNALRRALPGDPLVSIVSSSADESKLLLVASSDTDPGMIYRFDKGSKRLEQVMALRESLDGMPMGEMKPVTYSAQDGTQIPAYLTLPPGSDGVGIPAIVMPHGGPSSRDEWGFDWLAQYFAQRGFAVLQPNFRGSAGYGDAWYLKNGFQSWDVSIGDVADAGRWLIGEGIADPDKLAIVGWSYGGYAALQSQVVAPDLFKATVAIAPVTDLELLKSNSRFFANSRLVKEFVGTGGHLSAGSPLRNVGAITSPLMLFHGDVDQNVDVDHSRKMASALKDAGKTVEYVEYEDLTHGIRDNDKRADMLRDADRFLSEHLGMQ